MSWVQLCTTPQSSRGQFFLSLVNLSNRKWNLWYLSIRSRLLTHLVWYKHRLWFHFIYTLWQETAKMPMESPIFRVHETKRTCIRYSSELTCPSYCANSYNFVIYIFLIYVYFLLGYINIISKFIKKSMINSKPSNRNVTTHYRWTFVLTYVNIANMKYRMFDVSF